MPISMRERSFARNPLTAGDLAGLEASDFADVVTKVNVWPRPDWQELVDSGVSPKQAAFARIVYRRLAPVPVDIDGNRQAHENYVSAVGIIRDVLTTRQSGSLVQIADLLAETLRSKMGAIGGGCFCIQSKTSRTPPFRLRDDDIAQIHTAISTGFPGPVKTWKRGVTLKQCEDGSIDVFRSGFLVAQGLPSADAVWSHLEKQQSTYADRAVRPDLFRYTRNGPEQVDTILAVDDLREAFGLREVLTKDSLAGRGGGLGEIHDCLADLADAMGVDRQAIGLAGSLSVSVGNSIGDLAFSHLKTDGKVAHVFATLLVAFAQRIVGALEQSVDAVVERCWRVDRPSDDVQKEQHQELIDARQCVQDREAQLAGYKVTGSRRAGLPFVDGRGSLLDHQRRLEEAQHELAMLNGSKGSRVSTTVSSDFGAAALRERSYDSTHSQPSRTMLFTRAFEAWISDRLTSMGRHNDILVHSTEPGRAAIRNGLVYPAGIDRKALSHLFVDMAAMIPEPAPQPKPTALRP